MEVGWAGSAPHFIYMHHTYILTAPAHRLFRFCCLLFGLHVLISMWCFPTWDLCSRNFCAPRVVQPGGFARFYELVDSQLTAEYAESPDEDANVMTLETLAAHWETCS